MRKRIVLVVIFLFIAGESLWYMSKILQKEFEKEEEMVQYALEDILKAPTVAEVSENPYIYRYNHRLCKEKGLTETEDSLSRRYLCMQAIYRANLDAYLLDALDIRQLDEEMRSSSLGFVSPKPEDRDLYERESTLGLKYIYLRNNLYIEYLEREQLDLLEHQLKTGKEAVTDEIRKMVKETYQEIIRVREPEERTDSCNFFYAGTEGNIPEIPNHALVLKISNVMEYDASGNLFSDDRMKEKREYLDRVKMEKEKEYSDILGIEVYILLE